MQPKVTILILNYNNWSDTYECLKSLKGLAYDNYQILVVDNGSDQKPEQSLGVSVIYNQDNLGFSGGNNVGIKEALKKDSDYILLLNNDTTVEKDFLKKMIEVGENDFEAGILGSKIYFYNQPNKIWFAGGVIAPFKIKGYHLGLNEKDKGQYEETDLVDYITGCCMLIKREVIDTIGYLDEDYFLYYEDSDYCWRARKAGFKCLMAPQAKIYHKCSVGLGEASPTYVYYHIRNAFLMVKKNGSTLAKFNLYLIQGPWLAFKQKVKWLLPFKRKWAKVALKGLKDFYLNRTGKYDYWN